MSACFSLTHDRTLRETARSEAARVDYERALSLLQAMASGGNAPVGRDDELPQSASSPQQHPEPRSQSPSRASVVRTMIDPMSAPPLRFTTEASQPVATAAPQAHPRSRGTPTRWRKQSVADDSFLSPLLFDDEVVVRAPPLSPIQSNVRQHGFIGPSTRRALAAEKVTANVTLSFASSPADDSELVVATSVNRNTENFSRLNDEVQHHQQIAADDFTVIDKYELSSCFADHVAIRARASRLGDHPLPTGAPPPMLKPTKQRSALVTAAHDAGHSKPTRPQSAAMKKQERRAMIAELLRSARPRSATIRLDAPPATHDELREAAAALEASLVSCVLTAAVGTPLPRAATTSNLHPAGSRFCVDSTDAARLSRRYSTTVDRLRSAVDSTDPAVSAMPLRATSPTAMSAAPAAASGASVHHDATPAADGAHASVFSSPPAPTEKAAQRVSRAQTQESRVAPERRSTTTPEKRRGAVRSGGGASSPPPTPFAAERRDIDDPVAPDVAAAAAAASVAPLPSSPLFNAAVGAAADPDVADAGAQDLADYLIAQKAANGSLRSNGAAADGGSVNNNSTMTSASKSVFAASSTKMSRVTRRRGPPGLAGPSGSSSATIMSGSSKAQQRAEARDLERRMGPQVQAEKVGKYVWNPDDLLPRPPFRRPQFSPAYVASLFERYSGPVQAALPKGRLPTARVAVVVGASEFDDPSFAPQPQVYEDAMAIALALERAGYQVHRLIGRGGEPVASELLPGMPTGKRSMGGSAGSALGDSTPTATEVLSASSFTSPTLQHRPQSVSFLQRDSTSPLSLAVDEAEVTSASPIPSMTSPSETSISVAEARPTTNASDASAMGQQATTVRPTLAAVSDAVAKFMVRAHLYASVLFVFVGYGCFQDCMAVSDSAVKMMCCADSRMSVPSSFFPVDVTSVTPPALASKLDVAASSSGGGNNNSGGGSATFRSASMASSGDEGGRGARERSNVGTICDLRAIGYQQHGIASVNVDSLGGVLAAEYQPIPSVAELPASNGGVLASILTRALAGKAVRDLRITPNSLNCFIASRLTFNKIKCYTTATPMQFGDVDLVNGKVLNTLRATLRAKRLAKSRAFTSIKMQCLVSEVSARDWTTVTSQFLRRIRTTPKWHVDREYLAISSSYLLGTFYVVFRTKDAYNMAIIELDGHCKRNIKLPSLFGADGSPQQSSPGAARSPLRSFGGSASSPLFTSASGTFNPYAVLTATTVRESALLRLRIEVPSEPASVRQDAISVVKQYIASRSLAAKIFVLGEINVLTTERGQRKLDGLMRHHQFAPSLVLHSTTLDKEQMARIYAAITIQAYWRRFATQKRFRIARRLLSEHRKASQDEFEEWVAGWREHVVDLHTSQRAVVDDAETATRLRLADVERIYRGDVFKTLLRDFSRAILGGGGPLAARRPMTYQERIVPAGRAEQAELGLYTMLLSDDENVALNRIAPDPADVRDGCLPQGMVAATEDARHLTLGAMCASHTAALVQRRALAVGIGAAAVTSDTYTFVVTRRFMEKAPTSVQEPLLQSTDSTVAAVAAVDAYVIVRSRGEIDRDEERKRFLLEWRAATEEIAVQERISAPGVFAMNDIIVREVRGRFELEDDAHVELLSLISEMRRFLVIPPRLMPEPPRNPLKWM